MLPPANAAQDSSALLAGLIGWHLDIFAVGMLGGISIELIAILSIYEAGATFPIKYRNAGFWIVRVLVALVSGLLPLIYSVSNYPAALQIGASTPAVLAALAAARRKDDGPAGEVSGRRR